MAHSVSNCAPDEVRSATVDALRKIPAPITPPMTMAAASQVPRRRRYAEEVSAVMGRHGFLRVRYESRTIADCAPLFDIPLQPAGARPFFCAMWTGLRRDVTAVRAEYSFRRCTQAARPAKPEETS